MPLNDFDGALSLRHGTLTHFWPLDKLSALSSFERRLLVRNGESQNMDERDGIQQLLLLRKISRKDQLIDLVNSHGRDLLSE